LSPIVVTFYDEIAEPSMHFHKPIDDAKNGSLDDATKFLE
jgi:hypothetical protein